ncbi:Hypothetical predicted protein [Marmota monax]|uniref:Uncharacterized protein n=1 Tax=Marmota monax TaxID=9995 RepID=A0A5E4D6C7_MARMO|nr:Hypothetical predicted protein [Marmota monax]
MEGSFQHRGQGFADRLPLPRWRSVSPPLGRLLQNQKRSVNWAPGAAGAPARTMGRPVALPGAWRPECERLAGPGRRRRPPASCCLSQGNVPSRGPAQEVSAGLPVGECRVTSSGLETLSPQMVPAKPGEVLQQPRLP